ncbi:GmrSD restriction endonuclease domain-containing protein, partial [Mycobacterium timonense]
NYDFDVKKAKYFTSRKGAAIFALTTQVLGYQEWTPAVIEQRQAELTNKLESEWKLN